MNARRAVLIGTLVVAVVLLVLAANWQPRGVRETEPATGLRVVVVGVDGMDWFLLNRYAEEGKLPTFERLLRSSVAGEIAADQPPLPQVGWLCLGSGRALTSGERATVESDGNHMLYGIRPDVVRIAREEGLSAVSLGWPASWPADRSDARIVAAYAPGREPHPLTLSPTLFRDAPGQASDDELAELVRKTVEKNENTYLRGFAKRVYGGDPGRDPVGREHLLAAKWSYLADAVVADLAARLLAEEEPDLTLVYFGGLDAVGHRFLAPALPEYFPDLPETAEKFRDVLPNYYRVIDDAVGRILRLLDERTILIVCSAYGTHPSAAVPLASGGHEMGPPGVLIVRGPELDWAGRTLTVSTLDIVPTVLAALGVPIPNTLEGRIIVDALPVWLVERFTPTHVAAGGRPDESSPAPPDMVETLEGLSTARMEEIRWRGEATPARP